MYINQKINMKKKQYDFNKFDIDLSKYDKYHGIKICINNSIKQFRVSKKLRIIEFNNNFYSNLSLQQRAFAFEWARNFIKKRNTFLADEKTMKWAKTNNINQDEIYSFYSNYQFFSKRNKSERMYYLVTEDFYINKINQFKEWIIKIFKKK